MIPRMLLAAALSLAVMPGAGAQIRVNSVSVGHVTSSHAGLLPYIRSTQGIKNFNGGVRGSNTGDTGATVVPPRRARAAPAARRPPARAAASATEGADDWLCETRDERRLADGGG